jgi:hypothetical protein
VDEGWPCRHSYEPDTRTTRADRRSPAATRRECASNRFDPIASHPQPPPLRSARAIASICRGHCSCALRATVVELARRSSSERPRRTILGRVCRSRSAGQAGMDARDETAAWDEHQAPASPRSVPTSLLHPLNSSGAGDAAPFHAHEHSRRPSVARTARCCLGLAARVDVACVRVAGSRAAAVVLGARKAAGAGGGSGRFDS